MRILAGLLALALLGAVAPAQDQERAWDQETWKAFDALLARFWEARPPSRFTDWDEATRAALMDEAKAFPPFDGKTRDAVVEKLLESMKTEGPDLDDGGKKARIETPWGEAWAHVARTGRDKGLVIGLHGGGEGAGSADEPLGTWSVKDCMGLFPQGIRLVHDTWNTVHGERFVLTLIEWAKARHGIDPERVHVAGFSMGGTGSWFMAGRHPDLFASAIPAAGVLMASPQSQLARKEEITAIQHGLVPNVRNLPIWSYIGDADTNCKPGTFLYVADRIAELRAEDPEGWTGFHFTCYPKLPHRYPPGEPKKGLNWAARQTRDARPEHLLWEYALRPFPLAGPDDPGDRITKRHFYWLRCEDPLDRQVIRARRAGNAFTIEVDGRPHPRGGRLSIMLDDALFDPAEPVTVHVDGEKVWEGRPLRRLDALLDSFDAKLDRGMLFDRRIDL